MRYPTTNLVVRDFAEGSIPKASTEFFAMGNVTGEKRLITSSLLSMFRQGTRSFYGHHSHLIIVCFCKEGGSLSPTNIATASSVLVVVGHAPAEDHRM